MLQRRRVVVVLILLFVLVVFLVRFFTFSNSTIPRVVRNMFGIGPVASSTIYDFSGSKIPFDVYFDAAKGIVISGVVINVIDSDIKSLEIESELNGKHVLVRSTFPEVNPVIVLKLPDGKPVDVEEWTGYFFNDIRESILTGKQAVIHIESDEENAKKILTQIETQSSQVEVGEIARMILPE